MRRHLLSASVAFVVTFWLAGLIEPLLQGARRGCGDSCWSRWGTEPLAEVLVVTFVVCLIPFCALVVAEYLRADRPAG